MSSSVFDPVAVVVDWLDACKARRLDDLLDLYDAKASLRCACEGLHQGREELTRYWSGRLERAVPNAFAITDLAADEDGVKPGIALDYVAYDGNFHGDWKNCGVVLQPTESGVAPRTRRAPSSLAGRLNPPLAPHVPLNETVLRHA